MEILYRARHATAKSEVWDLLFCECTLLVSRDRKKRDWFLFRVDRASLFWLKIRSTKSHEQSRLRTGNVQSRCVFLIGQFSIAMYGHVTPWRSSSHTEVLPVPESPSIRTHLFRGLVSWQLRQYRNSGNSSLCYLCPLCVSVVIEASFLAHYRDT